ncbi:hypothetical protein DRP44_07725 [candidate division TA06 bacterium]|uniref:Uncharacterized protein n=1 Tax=candidate division TA06 bacterium TaxID=2250710 RepID=A0A660S6L7_UNCT6|nr:MAG: hypothetical protein DRP44_07725 [candidate division TA06 bacterium]
MKYLLLKNVIFIIKVNRGMSRANISTICIYVSSVIMLVNIINAYNSYNFAIYLKIVMFVIK